MVKISAGITSVNLPDPPKKATSKKYQQEYKQKQEDAAKTAENKRANALIDANKGDAVKDELEKGADKVEKAKEKAEASGHQYASKNDAQGTYWSDDMVWNYLTGFTNVQVRMNRVEIAKDLADDANNISGMQATRLVEEYAINGYDKMDDWNLRYNSVLQVDIGGGQPDVGTNKLDYKSWVVIIQTYYGNATNADEQAYMIACKGYFRNISDESLFALWDAWKAIAINADITSEEDLKANGLSAEDIKEKIWVSKDTFKDLTDTNEKDSADLEKPSPEAILFFSKLLYNWYCENPNFYSGSITVPGDPNYRVGMKTKVTDTVSNETYEFYIESVSHSFSFDEGFTSTLGVTRGLPNAGADRFTHLWGHNKDFVGGLMGESTLGNLAMTKVSSSTNNSDTDNPDDSGSGAGGDWKLPKGLRHTDSFGSPRKPPPAGMQSHDGNDFSGNVGDKITAVHGGKVIYCKMAPSGWAQYIGAVVVTKSDDGYYVVYQEFGSTSDIAVKKNDTVKTGDTIAKLSQNQFQLHVHIGVSKKWSWQLAGTSTKGWIDLMKLVK